MNKLFVAVLLCAVPMLAHAQDPEAGEVAPEPAEAKAEEKPAEAPPSDAAVEPATETSDETASEDKPEYDTRYPNKKYLDAVHERAKHMSLGYALGRHGEGFIFGPRFDLPVTKKNWGYLQFFQYTNFGTFRSPMDPVLMFGTNFITRTELIMGIFRLYGGGGFFVGIRPSPSCKNPLDASDISRAWVDEGQDPSLLPPADGVQMSMPGTPAARVAARIDAIADKCEEQKDAFTISGGGTGGIEFFSSPMRAYFIELSGGGGAQKNGIWSDTGLVLRAGNQFYF